MRYTKFYFEVLLSLIIVTVLTLLTYHALVGFDNFWSSQALWSYALMLCWIIVSAGYFHQGWIIRQDASTAHLSFILPVTVFAAQCILFVKGIHFHDWSLICGAVLVNSGVVFDLYNIALMRRRRK